MLHKKDSQKPATTINNNSLVQTSKNNPALAKKIRQASKEILKKSYKLYKNLENK